MKGSHFTTRLPGKLGVSVMLTALLMSPVFGAEALRSIVAHPFDSSTFYAVPQLGGERQVPSVYRSTDGGLTWQPLAPINKPVSSSLTSWTVATAIAVDPHISGADTLFVATPELGVFSSIDDGTSWAVWNDAAIEILDVTTSNLQSDPAWALSFDGSVYVTFDRGRIWTLVSTLASSNVTAIAHGSSDTAYVGTKQGSVLRTLDAGMNWSNLTNISFSNGGLGPLPGKVIQVAKGGLTDLFAVVARTDGSGNALFKGSGIGNATWSEVLINGQAADVSAMAASGNLIYVVEDDSQASLLVSSDDGATWQTRTLPSVSAINSISVKPCCSDTVYLATDGGGFASTDGGNTWNALAALVPPAPPPPITPTTVDLAVAVITPNASSVGVGSNSFQIQVTNQGPDTANRIFLEIATVVWSDSALGDYEFADSITPASGGGCTRFTRTSSAFGFVVLTVRAHVCFIDELASGASEIITLRKGTSADEWNIEVRAEITGSSGTDPNPGNNETERSYRIVEQTNGGGGSGGGAFGPAVLLLLLTRIRRRHH